MKTVTIKHGLDTKFNVEVEDGATAQDILNNAVVQQICGTHGGASLNGVVMTNVDVSIPEGSTLTPMTKANEKG